MTTRFAAAALLGALALSPGAAPAEEEAGSLEEVVVESAHTPADHLALAAYYRAQADEARAAAQRHQVMGRAYLRGKSGGARPYQSHCRRISEQQEAIAQEYEALAKLHDEEAKQSD